MIQAKAFCIVQVANERGTTFFCCCCCCSVLCLQKTIGTLFIIPSARVPQNMNWKCMLPSHSVYNYSLQKTNIPEHETPFLPLYKPIPQPSTTYQYKLTFPPHQCPCVQFCLCFTRWNETKLSICHAHTATIMA